MKEYVFEKERPYAQRITDAYKRVLREFGIEKAMMFNEFIRGASLLDGVDRRLLVQIENLSLEEMTKFIKKLETEGEEMRRDYKAETLYEVFEKIAAIGRTKLFIWKEGKYQEIRVSEDEKKYLPWAGKIQSGGPEPPSIIGTVLVAEDLKLVLGPTAIVINGHVFA